MRSSFFVLLCLLVFSSLSGYPKTRLIYSGSAIGKPASDSLHIKTIHRAFLADKLILKLDDKKKIKVEASSVWGYEASDNTIYRYNKGEFLTVKDADGLVIYSAHHGKSTSWYFSKTADSEVFHLTTKNLKKQFADNACFLAQLKSIKWYQDYTDYSRHSKHYRIASLYKSCGS